MTIKKMLVLVYTLILWANNLYATQWDIWLTPVNTYSSSNQNIDVEVHLDTGTRDADSFVIELNWDEALIALDTTINWWVEDANWNEVSNINTNPSSWSDIRFVYNKW